MQPLFSRDSIIADTFAWLKPHPFNLFMRCGGLSVSVDVFMHVCECVRSCVSPAKAGVCVTGISVELSEEKSLLIPVPWSLYST